MVADLLDGTQRAKGFVVLNHTDATGLRHGLPVEIDWDTRESLGKPMVSEKPMENPWIFGEPMDFGGNTQEKPCCVCQFLGTSWNFGKQIYGQPNV